MSSPATRWIVALSVVGLVSGCMGSMERQSFCAETRCDQQVRSCLAEVRRRCDECWQIYQRLVLSGEIPISSCEASCNNRYCYDLCVPGERSECVRTGYRFSLPAADPAVEAACRRAQDRSDRCGERGVLGRCEINARVERPEAAGAYDCVANTACGGSTDHCFAGLRSGTLGDEICARMDQVCGQPNRCGPDDRAAFNAWQGWLRDDVVQAARSCLSEPSCEQLHTCLSAWVDTLLGRVSDERR